MGSRGREHNMASRLDGLGTVIKFYWMQSEQPPRTRVSPTDVAIRAARHVSLAQCKLVVLKGSQVEAADGLVPALEAAFRAGGVHLIAAPIDYSENTRVLIDELQSASLDR